MKGNTVIALTSKKMTQDFSNISLEDARSIEAKQTQKKLFHDFLMTDI